MTATTAGQAANRARHSTYLEILTRTGLIGYGILHLAVAWLAIQIATGKPSTSADQAGAFRLVEEQPAGKFILVVIAAGLAAMALWQLLLAITGHREYYGRRRTLERVASAARVVIYGFLCWTAVNVLQGSAQSSASKQEKATAGILAHPAGQVFVAIFGLVVLGIGIGLFIYGFKKKFQEKLRTGQMTPGVRKGVIRLGQVGYMAKGVAFAVAGVLIFQAAVSNDAQRSRGLDGALRTLADKSFGGFLLWVVAIGIAAFGVYCFFQSRYRKV